MTAEAWMGMLGGLLLAAVVTALAQRGLRGDRYVCCQACRFTCPRFGADVDCELVQDLRTGRWTEVLRCSQFPGAVAVPCERDCAGRLNLGFRLGGWQQTLQVLDRD